MNKLCASALLLPLSLSTFAADDEDKKLKSELELGVIVTSGNTKTESYKGKLDVKHELTHWRNHYVLQGLMKRDEVETDTDTGTETNEQTTAEKYFGSAQGDYKLNKEHAALFILGEYERNRFSGYDYQYTIAIGYTDRLFTTDNSYLSYDIGPGMSVDKVERVEGEPDTDAEETFVVRFAAEYLYQFSENAKFTQNVSSNISTESDKNTKTKAISALTAQINSSFALRASFTVDHNSEVAEGRTHTDKETAITVVYSF